ncbi:hypothetical protein OTU49_011365 [Cherax quadricarinatus]|uniref:Uncharacterized protein n=1 Tax=Cherax quadricarinatus TaxID=27406 RepID=A0AAW0W490_CHEQU
MANPIYDRWKVKWNGKDLHTLDSIRDEGPLIQATLHKLIPLCVILPIHVGFTISLISVWDTYMRIVAVRYKGHSSKTTFYILPKPTRLSLLIALLMKPWWH